MWQFKKVLERKEFNDSNRKQQKKRAIAAINRAAVACALVVAGYVLETAVPQLHELTMGISASKIIACLVFVIWCRSALEAVDAFLDPKGGESQPKPLLHDFRSRFQFLYKPFLSAILVITIAAVAIIVAVVTALLVLYIRDTLFDAYSTHSFLRVLCFFFIPCMLLCA
jgi:hypothetical protein